MTAPRIGEIKRVEVESCLSSTHPGQGFVTIRVLAENGDVLVSQTDVDTARQIGHQYLAAAEAAVHDAALYRLLTTEVEADDTLALHLIANLRQYRADRDGGGT